MVTINDAKDSDNGSDSAMVALLPMTNDWCQLDLPHMTLVYCGKVADLRPTDFNDIAKDVSSLATISSPIYTKVFGVRQFGEGTTEEPYVDALDLQPTPELWAMRRFLEEWSQSDWAFDPHCTIGPSGSAPQLGIVPQALAFDRLMVAWGSDSLVFSLRR